VNGSLPVVAVVGRPNVGKSTLVNRIHGRQVAIVEDRPGVTRDRKLVEAEWLGVPFVLIDTGGWRPGGGDLEAKVSRQVERGVKDADVVMLVVDASVGATTEDLAVAEWLRRAAKPVMVIANKADNDRRERDAWEFLSLGLGEAYPISALHGRRTGDMLDDLVGLLPQPDPGPAGEEPERDANLPAVPAVAIVGRPNVGKSTLFNRLIGEERSIVHDRPGTTRDAVDTVLETPEGPVRFVDTAGMRRKSRIDEGPEYYSLVRALRAVDAADIALLVIDATEGVTSQDQRLAERVDAAGCPVVVLLNKWDLLADAEARAAATAQLAQRLHFIGDAPVLKVSARTGKGVHKLLPVLADAIERYHRRVPTREVNRVIADAQQAQPAPGGARVLYALQGSSDPPTFTLFANRELPPQYLRYLERMLRERFDLGAVPIKLRVRRRSG
jgi:GTP-binding protein